MTGHIVRNKNRSGPMISLTRTQEKDKAKEDDNTSDGQMLRHRVATGKGWPKIGNYGRKCRRPMSKDILK